MKIAVKVITILLTLVLASRHGTSHSFMLLEDSKQGNPYPIALGKAIFASPPLQTVIIYLGPYKTVHNWDFLGAWTSFAEVPTDPSFDIQNYILGYTIPPVLHAGELIYTISYGPSSYLRSVQRYLDEGGNPKVLLPVVDADPPGRNEFIPHNIYGFVGFHIDGADDTLGNVYGHFNDPPIISGIPPVKAEANTNYIFTPTTSDPDGDSLLFSITNKPPWANFDSLIGALTGIAEEGDYNDIQISVNDGGFTSTLPTFNINVTLDRSNSVMVVGGATYPSISSAYSDNINGDVITIYARGINFPEILLFDQNKTVTLLGGYDSTFTDRDAGMSTINGLTVASGVVSLENLVIK